MSKPSSPQNPPAKPTPKGKSGGVIASGRSNTLGLNTTELDGIFNMLDSSSTSAAHKRESARVSFRQESIGVEIVQPEGGRTHMHVAGRNLSRTGLGFLHSSYIHVGTVVVMTLLHTTRRQAVRVKAKVVRCRHVTRHVHDVGVRFDEPINIRDFMAMDPLRQTFTCELVNPALLKGSVLVVAEHRMEQACVKTLLRDTPLDVIMASDTAEGLEFARQGAGIIICDDMFEKSNAVEFVQAVRKAGVRSPIIMMSADTSEASLDSFRKAQVDAFLAKPLEQSVLLRAIAEFLLASGAKSDTPGSMTCTLRKDSPLRALAAEFATDLNSAADTIEKLVKSNDIAGIRRQCLRLGGPSVSLGFEPIAGMAAALVRTLDAAKGLDECKAAIDGFTSVCRSATVEDAAAAAAPAEGGEWDVDPSAKTDAHAKGDAPAAHAPAHAPAPAAGAHAPAPAAKAA